MRKGWIRSNILAKNSAVREQKARKIKIERGAKDFAVRFEQVMKELANG